MEEAVTPSHIAGVVSRWTGVPVDKMLEGEREKLLAMEHPSASASSATRGGGGGGDRRPPVPRRVAGSEPADRLVHVPGAHGRRQDGVDQGACGLPVRRRHRLVRIDMSEYMEKHAVSRLIGAPPGYVGYEEGGALTEAVRRRPYQVVLFDEIEKAHPDVFNVLLQVLDDGRLTDGQGRTVDFRNTLLIMTSNLGAEYLVNQPAGQDTEAVRDEVMGVVRSHFRPEFLNRVDEIILFHRLKREEMGSIVEIQLGRLQKLWTSARSSWRWTRMPATGSLTRATIRPMGRGP
ncbi:hypothetical protein Lal_00013165 [Lupinus albus]|nr:hypothetical protein Lal_00013165 [Lupinus albus]